MPETIKNSTLANNKIETDVTKNGKNSLDPRVQSLSVQPSRVQVSRSPESKHPAVQSPSAQLSKVQEPSRPEPKCPEAKRPDHTPKVYLSLYAFLNVVIQTLMLFIATGFVTMLRLHCRVYSFN